jgi:diguanylate cyclase (GGDEF)-like protein
MRRARAVATGLEKIARDLRKGLAQYQSGVSRFKQQVVKLTDHQQQAAWRELCRGAEDVLKPTLRLAAQIANAQEEIRQQAASLTTFTEGQTDPLTGVSNRRALDDTLVGQFAMMNRYNRYFSIVMFDVDFFKQINDQAGHPHGDRVLQDLARLLDESVRETDLVARYGGDEFVIIMPETDLDGASVFAERLRAKVGAEMALTVSAGVAQASNGDTPQSLFAKADGALYQAKSSGRNCVFRHTGERIEPVLAEAPASL